MTAQEARLLSHIGFKERSQFHKPLEREMMLNVAIEAISGNYFIVKDYIIDKPTKVYFENKGFKVSLFVTDKEKTTISWEEE